MVSCGEFGVPVGVSGDQLRRAIIDLTLLRNGLMVSSHRAPAEGAVPKLIRRSQNRPNPGKMP